MNLEELADDLFDYKAWNKDQVAKGQCIRDAFKNAYMIILMMAPDSKDRDAALRKLRECRMDCNSAITHDGKY